MSNKSCSHVITYYGAINILAGHEIEAVIDVYHCRKCKAIFADLRRIGIPVVLGSKLGFEELEEGNDWFLLVCIAKDKHKFYLIQSEIGKSIKHECIDKEEELRLEKEEELFRSNDTWHRIFRIRKFINKEIEILH